MEFFICLAFLIAGLAGSNHASTEEAYLFGKTGIVPMTPLKNRYGTYYSRLATLFMLVSCTLLSALMLQEMVSLFSEESLLSSAYVTLFTMLMLWRGGFYALVRVLGLLLILSPFYDYPFPYAFIAGCISLGALWLIQTTLTVHTFMKPEPKENFLRAGCIVAIFASLTYFVNTFEISRTTLAALPALSLTYPLLSLPWKKSHSIGAFASTIGTLLLGIFTQNIFMLVSWNLSVGILASLVIEPKKIGQASQ